MITLTAIREAASRIAGKVHRTPLLSSRSIGERAGVRLHLKCKNLQRTGSFKPRGALAGRVSGLAPETRVVAVVSGGNLDLDRVPRGN